MTIPLFLAALCAFLMSSWVQAQTPCERLPNALGKYSPVSILNSSLVEAGKLSYATTENNSVSLCRVQAQIGYALNLTLGTELWLPENWNGRFMAVGNGGLAGQIDYSGMLTQLNSGYAVAAGDSGHLLVNNGNGTLELGKAIPFLDDVDQTTMWIHDSMATLTPPLRHLTEAYYGRKPSYSYYVGCSTGGAQGFALAQWHPHLFDGIVAGCPGNYYSHLILGFLYNYQAAHSQQDNSSFLHPDTLNFITNATLDACDRLDGVEDRVIENPLACDFNVSSLACADGQLPVSSDSNGTQCLTAAQLVTARAIYRGPISNDSTQVYPGFDAGSESSWTIQQEGLATNYTFPILQNLVFKNLSYDPKTFNFDTDVARVNQSASPYIDSTSSDLSAYKARGGKLIVTQGWADPYNAGTWPITHMSLIDGYLSANGHGRAEEFMRLFMIPGGGHCGSSPAYPYVPVTPHSLEALVDWVENGVEPVEVLADKPADGGSETKKLCAWPQTAKLVSGDGSRFEDFECVQA